MIGAALRTPAPTPQRLLKSILEPYSTLHTSPVPKDLRQTHLSDLAAQLVLNSSLFEKPFILPLDHLIARAGRRLPSCPWSVGPVVTRPGATRASLTSTLQSAPCPSRHGQRCSHNVGNSGTHRSDQWPPRLLIVLHRRGTIRRKLPSHN